MSDEEKFAVQGRVYAELKQAKASIATLTEVLSRYSQDLEEISRVLQRFLLNPEDQEGGSMLQDLLRKVTPPERIARLVGELDTETQRAAMLQQRVDRF